MVLRYMLSNPRKAGICSASEYECGDRERYVAFIAAPNDDKCMEYETAPRDDDWAR